MQRTILTIALFACFAFGANAQLSFSLKEAQEYAVKNSFNAQNAQLDVETAKSKIKETIAVGLPQITAEGGYNDNVQIPTSVVPGQFFGGPPGSFYPVKFGVRHQATGSVTATQLLFNGSYIVGLQASKAYAELVNTQKTKTEIQVRQDVANFYFLTIASNENVQTLQQAAATLEKTYEQTKALYDNGLAEEQSADQLRISLNSLKNSLEFAQMQAIQMSNVLKFSMGLPQTTDLLLTDNAETLTMMSAADLIETSNDPTVSIDYKMSQNVLRMQELNLKNRRAAYLPTLAMFATHQENAFANDFKDFKYKGFFPASIIGLKLTVPLFSSGMKHQQVVQAKLDLNRAKISETLIKEAVSLEQQNSRNTYKFRLKNFDIQKENFQLADKVKQKTTIKFQEGLASSFELAQTERQYLDAQAGYIQSLIDMLNAQIAFQKAFNKLN